MFLCCSDPPLYEYLLMNNVMIYYFILLSLKAETWQDFESTYTDMDRLDINKYLTNNKERLKFN